MDLARGTLEEDLASPTLDFIWRFVAILKVLSLKLSHHSFN
jgi:hypothetical protein